MAAEVRVHRFDSTSEAYNSAQTGYVPAEFEPTVSSDDDFEAWAREMREAEVVIATGDVLVVESEGAVAVLVEAWPVAIEASATGEAFHEAVREGFQWGSVMPVGGGVALDLSDSARVAVEELAKLRGPYTFQWSRVFDSKHTISGLALPWDAEGFVRQVAQGDPWQIADKTGHRVLLGIGPDDASLIAFRAHGADWERYRVIRHEGGKAC